MRNGLRGLPIYLVHGRLDWMFPVQVARQTREALSAAGADVTYREIDDLSHSYPREINPAILNWLRGDDEFAGRTRSTRRDKLQVRTLGQRTSGAPNSFVAPES